jgi:hypothetical protein
MATCHIVFSQTYLFNGFEDAFVGSPAAPAGGAATIPAGAAGNWTQQRLNIRGDNSVPPTAIGTDGQKDFQRLEHTGMAWSPAFGSGSGPSSAAGGSGVLYINDYNFGGAMYGVRRVISPTIDLSSSTSPYVRFKFVDNNTTTRGNLRIMISNDGGVSFNVLQSITPNGGTAWTPIAIKIPTAYKTANVKVAIEMTNKWSVNSLFIDDFYVQEFTPATITSAATGNWNVGTTWVGGIPPTAEDNVVIAAGHTVTASLTGNRCQNLTVDGIMQGSATATHIVHILGDLIVNSTGTYRSFNGTAGRITMLGGNLVNNGVVNFTSFGTGAAFSHGGTTNSLLWMCGGEDVNIGGTGIYQATSGASLYNFWTSGSGTVKFDVPIVVGYTFALYEGRVNANGNLTLGVSTRSTTQTIERAYGQFIGTAPTFGTGVTHNVSYVGTSTATALTTVLSPRFATITTGHEIKDLAGVRTVDGTLTLNTVNHVQLGYPVTLGTPTAGTLTMTQGILFTTLTNILTLNRGVTGSTGTSHSTATAVATTGDGPTTHGSFISGPVKVLFPTSGTSARNIPFGVGTDYLATSFTGTIGTPPNYTINNVVKLVTLNTTTAWGSQEAVFSLDGAPSGTVNAPLNLIMGTRSVKMENSGGIPMPSGFRLDMRGHASGINGGGTLPASSADGLTGSLPSDLRLAEADALTGTWNSRSTAAGTGSGTIASPYVPSTGSSVYDASTSTTTKYYAFGTISSPVDIMPTALFAPGTGGCYSNAENVVVTIRNNGLVTHDFSVNPTTITCNVTGAATATLTLTINSGTLAPSATNNYTLTPTLDMTAIGTYNFAISTSTPGDGNLTNDNLSPTPTRTVDGISKTPIASGNWNTPAIWCDGAVPTATNTVTIPNGFTVTINGADADAATVTVATGGTLNVTANTLNVVGAATTGILNNGTITINGGTVNVGPTDNSFCNRRFTNNGTLTVSSGTLNVAGNYLNAAASTLNQSGGEINIDGNAGGVAANSVASGTAIVRFENTVIANVNLTGGTFTIVDPHANSTLSDAFSLSSTTTGTFAASGTHTFRFGNGISTDAGGNAAGFYYQPWVTTAGMAWNNIEVHGPATPNRIVTQPASWGALIAHKNLSVLNNGELRQSGTATNGAFIFGGDLAVDMGSKLVQPGFLVAAIGLFTSGSTIGINPVTSPQFLVASPLDVQNLVASPTANLTNFQSLNSSSSGVTFFDDFSNPTFSGAITVSDGRLNAQSVSLVGSSAQTVTLTAATSSLNIADLLLNNTAGATLAGLGFVNTTGTTTVSAGTLNAGGRLVLKSTATRTARIAPVLGSISGDITQERFIPAKATRRFSFISSPVSQALSAAWQQQIHITGSGTGGTACPTLSAHTNGFDATLTNAPSMFSYDASLPSGSRWVANSVGTTSFTLTPGDGYRLNVRGPRTAGCSLLDGTSLSPAAVTLSATGAMTGGVNLGTVNKTYNNNLAGNWVLVGNPYPSELNFSAFQSSNAAEIGSSYVLYDPQNAPDPVVPANMYSTWNAGVWSNAPTSITGANGQYIANSQAFFVQANNAANVNLAFGEAHKHTGTQNGVFRMPSWKDLIRISLNKEAVVIDQTVIRFGTEAAISNDKLGTYDATLMSSSNAYLGSRKADKTLSIQTRSLSNVREDEISLAFEVANSGTYTLNFSEYEQSSIGSIYLVDKLTGTKQDVKQNSIYSFSVDKNNAQSFGAGRFVLVFSNKVDPVLVQGIKMYPNPANREVTVQLPNTTETYTVRISNVSGKVVMEQIVTGNVQTLQVGKLAGGVYVVELIDSKGNRTTDKLVKQ